MDPQRTQALTNSHGTRSGLGFHLTNAVIEDLRIGRAKGSEVLTSAKSVRQSGWRLKFPENLATAPVIGRSHWSQIIRMLVTSTWGTPPKAGACQFVVITSYATTTWLRSAKDGEKCGMKVAVGDIMKAREVRVIGRSDNRFRMIPSVSFKYHRQQSVDGFKSYPTNSASNQLLRAANELEQNNATPFAARKYVWGYFCVGWI
jgi:hypothetical protein